MKNQLISLTLAILTVACSSKPVNTRNDLELSNLKGPVWKVDRTNHSSQAGCVCPAAMRNDCNQSLVIYNEKGNIAESFDIDADGDTMVHSVYRYNKRGICTAIDKFNGKRLTGREIPEFEKGKLSRVRVFDENGTNLTTLVYKHLADELSETITLNADGDQISKTRNEYYDGNLVSQTETDKNGKIKSITKFKRNSQHDISESVISASTDTIDYQIVFEYEYDEKGNWVKQTKFYNGEIENVVMRNITYYKTNVSLARES